MGPLKKSGGLQGGMSAETGVERSILLGTKLRWAIGGVVGEAGCGTKHIPGLETLGGPAGRASTPGGGNDELSNIRDGHNGSRKSGRCHLITR